MAIIQLTQGLQTIIDDEDVELVSKYKWHAAYSGRKDQLWRTAYAKTHFKDESGRPCGIAMHNIILRRKPNRRMVVDHINRDALDNRKANLRIVTASQNIMNQSKHVKHADNPYRGVRVARNKYGKKWYAEIGANGKNVHGGFWFTPERAALAYNDLALKLHGECAGLNDLPMSRDEIMRREGEVALRDQSHGTFKIFANGI